MRSGPIVAGSKLAEQPVLTGESILDLDWLGLTADPGAPADLEVRVLEPRPGTGPHPEQAGERTQGAVDALKAAGFPVAQIVDAPQAKTDTESAFNAANIVFTKNAKFKRWIAFGMNDEAVLGAVRAGEGRGIRQDSMVGIGIGGSQTALNEFSKATATGFFGTVLISPHGYETAVAVFEWATQGKAPPPVTLTSGTLMTRKNQADVRKTMGL